MTTLSDLPTRSAKPESAPKPTIGSALARALARVPRVPRTALFGVGYIAAAAIAVFATFFAVSGTGPIGTASPVMWWLLLANLVIIIMLVTGLGRRLFDLLRAGQAKQAAARLHLRYAGLFSLSAVVPAIVVALFLGVTLSRGVESWFSDRVRSVVDGAVDVARAYVKESTESVRSEVVAMATDLNGAARMLTVAPNKYSDYLVNQATYRRFPAGYVINAQGAILARGESKAAVPWVIPSRTAFQAADTGDVAVSIDESTDIIRALFKLQAYDNAYLYVVRYVEPGVLQKLKESQDSVIAYREADERRAQLQTLFALAYFETVLIVLIGAAWLGLSAASRISTPIGRLAEAAQSVSRGDLSARVDPGESKDDLSSLASTFNRMTEELGLQRNAITTAREQAESRSRFIETVLTGVTAGVFGVDADGTITIANRSAGVLLDIAPESLIGQRLAAVAPEIAEVAARARPSLPAKAQVDRITQGETRSFDVRAAAEPGGPQFVITFDDVTPIVAAQRQAAWKDVARRIAHEIKNPLTPIQLSAERLQRKFGKEILSDPETFGKLTQTIVRQVSDIGRMVDEFSTFARMPAPRFASADLGEIVRQAAFAQRVASPDVDVTAETPSTPVAVEMDSRLVSQALANVLKNAAESIASQRARDPEGPQPRIRASLQAFHDFVVIEVIDDGIGLPITDRARLIEPYMTTREKGTGLGLAIVARILEEHGGSLELGDRPDGGRGACIRMVMPLQRAAVPASPTALPETEIA